MQSVGTPLASATYVSPDEGIRVQLYRVLVALRLGDRFSCAGVLKASK
jgi:hypothetical protein